MYLQRERSECGGIVLSDIDVASTRTVRADGERRRPFFELSLHGGWRLSATCINPRFYPTDSLYGSTLACELCIIPLNSKSHDSRFGRSSKTEGKGADDFRGSAGADMRRVLLPELGDRVRLEAFRIRCLDVLDAICKNLIWDCQPCYCSYL
jgi:hypothetical protein